MNHRLQWLVVSLIAAAPAWGCSSDENGVTADGSAGSGGTAGSGGAAGSATGGSAGAVGAAEAGVDASLDVSATPDAKSEAGDSASDAQDAQDAGDGAVTTAFFRVAHLSPGTPAFDVCLRARPLPADGGEAGASDGAADAIADAEAGSLDAGDASDGADGGVNGFTVGPVLKGLGITAGLAYSQVSTYIPVTPGLYDVRIVAPNAADCRAPLANLVDGVNFEALVRGTYSTIAAIGVVNSDVGNAFDFRQYSDERTTTAGAGSVRFVHASPGTPNVDVGTGTGESFVAVFSNVPYGGVGVGTGVDTRGYIQLPPVNGQTLVARVHGDSADALSVPGFSVAANQIVSTFAIGVLGSTATPPKVLVCSDLDISKAPLANCAAQPAP